MNASQKVDVQQFWDDGYSVIKGVFSKEEIAELRERVYRTCQAFEACGRVERAGDAKYLLGDLLSNKDLRHVVLDPRLRTLARQLLGEEPVYFGDSSVQIGKGLSGWHKDNRRSDRSNPKGDDWQGRYRLIRIGVYCQDHARYSGGLGVRKGSHKVADLCAGKPVLVDSEIGDVVVWSLLTTHSGNSTRVRWFPQIGFRDRIVRYLPRWMIRPEMCERIAFFLTFGSRSAHLDRYIEEYKSRDYGQQSLQVSFLDDEAWKTIRESKLEVVGPMAESIPSNLT